MNKRLNVAIPACQTNCGHIYCNTVKKLYTAGIFIKEFIRAPSTVGSICPSSKALAASLINAIPADEDGLIIDLGAGSGIVTELLVKAGVSPDRIVAVEISSGFSSVFSKRCPNVSLVIGDARSLESILSHHNPAGKVHAVISSLPLRIMPSDIVSEIMNEIRTVLFKRGGVFIQYTYALWMRYPLRQYGFNPCSAHLVLGNLPPAKVEFYAANPQ